MLDMMVLAFWTDTTRNITFMFANDVSPRNFSFLEGVRENHHSSSHHANQQAKIDSYKIITRWHVEQYAYLLAATRHRRRRAHAARQRDDHDGLEPVRRQPP